MFCLKCGRPDHMRDSNDCPNRKLSEKDSWPCLVCAQKHPGAGATVPCPNRGNKALHRCLNCVEAGLDDTNHRTDFYKCPAPTTLARRGVWRFFSNQLPDWAVSITFPSTDELRSRVEKGLLPRRPVKSRINADVNNSGQAVGSGAESGTRILNRSGLMKPKKDPKSMLP